MEVGVLQPAAVSVYEYYEQTPCVKFYHPKREGGQLLKLCKDDECTCAEGSTDVGPMGKLRPFLSYTHCRDAWNLQKGKTYLVMGSSRDIHRDEKKQTYQYVLGERTWIEYWPTAEECQGDEHRDTCLGLDEMLERYRVFACQQ